MRVLMVSDVYKPVINGVSFSIEIFLDELRELGHSASIVAPQFPGSVPETEVFRLRSLVFPLHKEQRLAFPFPRKIIRGIWQQDWDIVHVHTLFNLGFWGLWFAAKKKIPVVFTYHTLFEEYVHYIPLPVSFMKRLAVFWSRHFCNACDAIISPSGEIEKVLLEYGVKKKISVLPTPINWHSFEPVEQESPYEKKLGFSPLLKICLYVGRIAREKNMEFLLRAFRRINELDPSVRLVIIGDGPYRASLEAVANDLKLQGKAFFLGYVPRKELGTWFSKADVFLFASTTETQGMVLAEALLFGLPAVAVEGPGTRDVLQSGVNGFMTTENEDAFVEKVCRLLRNEDLRKKFSSQAALSVEKLKPERIVKALIGIYETAGRENKWKKK